MLAGIYKKKKSEVQLAADFCSATVGDGHTEDWLGPPG